MVSMTPARQLAPIDADELIDRLERYSLDDQLAWNGIFLEEAIELLQRLAANQYAVRRLIDRHGGLQQSKDHFTPPQTFHLLKGSRFGIRFNVWNKLKSTAFFEREKLFYAYDIAHNHNFNFLTIGYFGPGYVTELCEIDPPVTLLPNGSKVQLSNHRSEKLSPGAVLAFDAYSDVHSQLQPDELSISINLLSLHNPKGFEQVFVDLEKSTLISTIVNGEVGRIGAIIDSAVAFPTKRTAQIINRLADARDRPVVRELAEAGLIRLNQKRR